jgi:hypothetical protein
MKPLAEKENQKEFRSTLLEWYHSAPHASMASNVGSWALFGRSCSS